MRHFGLIGFPLGHSFSKEYFDDFWQREAIKNVLFSNYEIATIEELTPLLKDPVLHGLAVTIPYKKAVLPYLTLMKQAVKEMGACNCIRIKKGKLYGYNTDYIGFAKSFMPLLKPWHTHALILGTGGASAAVAYTLMRLGISYRFVSRQKDTNGVFLSYEELDKTLLGTYTVIINATPVGTFPEVDASPQIPYDLLGPKHYLYDLVYNPSLTRFLALGQLQGATIKNGADMLVIQAQENWRIWNS